MGLLLDLYPKKIYRLSKAAAMTEKGDRATVGGICTPTHGKKACASLGQLRGLLKVPAPRRPAWVAGCHRLTEV